MSILKKISIIVLSFIMLIVLLLAVVGYVIPAIKLSRLEKLTMEDSVTAKYTLYLPDEDTIYSYAKDLTSMGTRLPGTESGTTAQTYVKGKFEEFGLEDISIVLPKVNLDFFVKANKVVYAC